MELEYKQYTIRELINALTYLAKQLPEKEEAKITLSDTEGNRTYSFIEPTIDGGTITLQYEMHEKGSDNIQNLIDSGEFDDILQQWKQQGVL